MNIESMFHDRLAPNILGIEDTTTRRLQTIYNMGLAVLMNNAFILSRW